MKNEPELAQVFHFDLYGKREAKYDFLDQNSLKSIEWNILTPQEPNFFLVKKDFDESGMYEMGFKIDALFSLNASGITTERDNIAIHFDELTLKSVLNDFKGDEPEKIRVKYDGKPDGRDWKFLTAKQDVLRQNGHICSISYRPFDIRKTYYTGKSKGFMSYPRNEVMKHLLKENVSLIFERQASIGGYTNIFLSNCLVESHILGTMFSKGITAPLYLYPESQDLFAKTERTPNLNQTIINKMAEGLGIPFVAEKTPQSAIKNPQSFAPIDVLDYIYAVLHSPNYREKYKEFLKIDFPRVPFPKDLATFWKLVKLGGEIRQIHLLESEVVEEYITEYPEDGDNVVVKPSFAPLSTGEGSGVRLGRVYINENQYFDKVPETAWNFYIGGYQPAQKWLKDRKERELSFEDILHYQKIIVALTETARIMAEIDLVGVE